MPRPALQIIRDEHAAVAAVLRSLLQMVERGPGDEPMRFFDVLRAMLFYIDEFPERLHHPKESDLLFPKIARVAPQLMPVPVTVPVPPPAFATLSVNVWRVNVAVTAVAAATFTTQVPRPLQPPPDQPVR